VLAGFDGCADAVGDVAGLVLFEHGAEHNIAVPRLILLAVQHRAEHDPVDGLILFAVHHCSEHDPVRKLVALLDDRSGAVDLVVGLELDHHHNRTGPVAQLGCAFDHHGERRQLHRSSGRQPVSRLQPDG